MKRLAWIAASILMALTFGVFMWRRPHRAAPAGRPFAPAPVSAQEEFALGARALEAGRDAEARERWQRAVTRDPAFAPPYYGLVVGYEQARNYPVAAALLLRLRGANPKAQHVECRLAQIYLEGNRYVAAVAAMRAELQRDPNCPLAHTVNGMLLDLAGQHDAAIADLQAARKLAPRDQQITLTLAQISARAGHSAQAFALLDPLLAHPQNPPAAFYLMGWLLAEYGRGGHKDSEAAQRYLTKARALNPTSAPTLAETGRLLLRAGQTAEAKSLLQQAWQLDPTRSDVVQDLAAAYRRSGDARAAQQRERDAAVVQAKSAQLEKARGRYLARPDDLRNLLTLAALEADRGNRTDALELVRQTLKTNPDDRIALALLHRLM